jgi:hypothetical protein
MFEILFSTLFSLLVLGFGLLFVYLGLNILVGEIRNWRKAIASREWLSGVGRVISSELHISYGRHATYYPRAKYSYTVAGQNYTGDRIVFAWRAVFDRAAAEKVVESYRPGQMVTVFYDPQQPQASTLDQNFPWPLFELFCGVLVALCPGAVCSSMGISFLAETLQQLGLFAK